MSKSNMYKVTVKNLRLRTFIGFNPAEIKEKQDIIINYSFTYNADRAAVTDNVDDVVNYRSINKAVIQLAENGRFKLLEKLVNDVRILIAGNEGVQQVTVEVDKPNALRFADSVSISVSQKKKIQDENTCIISLGSNIEPEKNINNALTALRDRYTITQETNQKKTKPLGYTEQNDFINCAVKLITKDLLVTVQKNLRSIESAQHRVRDLKNPNGPRTIDLDVVVWNDEVIDPDCYTRDFLQDFVRQLSPAIL